MPSPVPFEPSYSISRNGSIDTYLTTRTTAPTKANSTPTIETVTIRESPVRKLLWIATAFFVVFHDVILMAAALLLGGAII